MLMVEMGTSRREVNRNGGNGHKLLRHKGIGCASQFTIPDMVGINCNPGG
jgi:hypothetical protein